MVQRGKGENGLYYPPRVGDTIFDERRCYERREVEGEIGNGHLMEMCLPE